MIQDLDVRRRDGNIREQNDPWRVVQSGQTFVELIAHETCPLPPEHGR